VKRKKKRKHKVTSSRVEEQLYGWLQRDGKMTQRRIVFPDSFPLLFYDSLWEGEIRRVYPRVQVLREGVGYRAFCPEVLQPRGVRLKASRDDLDDRSSSREEHDFLDLSVPYKVIIPRQLRPWNVLFVSYGHIRAMYVIIAGKKYVLELAGEYRSLSYFRTIVHERPLCYLNDPQEGRVYTFTVQ